MDPMNWIYTGGVEPNVMEGMSSDPWAARNKWLKTLLGDLNKQAGNAYQSVLGSLSAAGGEGSGAEMTGEAAIKTGAQEAYEKAKAGSAMDIMKMLRGEEQQKSMMDLYKKQGEGAHKWDWLNAFLEIGKTAAPFFI